MGRAELIEISPASVCCVTGGSAVTSASFSEWRVGRVVMQRIANPWTSVRFRYAPPLTKADYDI